MTTFPVADDVYGISLDEAETLAAYLVVDEEPAIVETGTAEGASALLAGVEAAGVDTASLRHAVIGHYHLDHAGGALALLDAAPELTCYIHESMAGWVTDQDRFETLVESTASALAGQFEGMGAPERPIPDDRLRRVGDDGLDVGLGETTLEIVHTPGHTPDHVSAYLSDRDVLFANEAIGRFFPRTGAFHPPVTVPTFDIEATAASIDRLEALDASVVALSHYGVHDDPTALFERARRELERFPRRIGELYEACDEDLAETVAAVRRELIDLDDGYPDTVAAVQADVCTRGFLRATGRL